MFGAALRAARLRSRGIPFAVAETPVRGQRHRLFRRRAHRRLNVDPVVPALSELVVLVVVVVVRLANRPRPAVRFAAVLAGAAALAVAVHVPVAVPRVRRVGGAA